MTRCMALGCLTLILLPACAPEAPPADEGAPAAEPAAAPQATPDDPIAMAMSAGPEAITSGATIVQFGEGGAMTELRAGTNGWTCLPDDPNTPGDDPMCLDAAWQQFIEAYTKRETPQVSAVGIAYMLQGGRVPSNTDPFATEPAPGESWIEDPPHIMIVVPDPSTLDALPTDPNHGGPYVMWKGTPYAHLMVPVVEN